MDPPSASSEPKHEQPHQDSNTTNAAAAETTPESTITAAAAATTTRSSSNHAMDNFRALVMRVLMASAKTNSSLTPSHTLLLERRLNDFIPYLHTPDHPPYAAMIRSAIEQLNDEGGSSEEAISKFIKETHNDLPWAHDSILKHHLRELCKSGDIMKTRDKCYLIGDSATRINPISSPSTPSSAYSTPTCSLSSSSAYCSSSNSSFSPGPCPKRKHKKQQVRRKGRSQGRRVEEKETCTSLNAASVRRRGRPSKKDVRIEKTPVDAKQTEATEKRDLVLQLKIGATEEEEYQSKERDEFQVEQDLLMSEEYGFDELSGYDNTQEGQANKQRRRRRKRRAHKKSMKGEETIQMLACLPKKGRGRPRRRLVFEETQAITEDTEAAKVGEPMIEDKADTAEQENQPFEEQNEVMEEEKKVLEKQFGVKVVDELVEQQKQVIVIGHDTEDEVNREQNHLSVNVIEVNKEPNKSLQLQQKVATEKCEPQGQEAKMEGQIEATSEQKFPGEDHEVPKKRRGRPPKTKRMGRGRPPKTSARGKIIQKKRQRVLGRKLGRPRKNDSLKEETQITTEQIESIEIHDLDVAKITGASEEKNDPKQERNLVNTEQNQVQGKQLEIIKQNLAAEINVRIDIELHGQEDMVCEEWTGEKEQQEEVSAVHNQSEVIEEQTEPGDHLVEVIDKQIKLAEQDDVIVQQNLLKGYGIIHEGTRVKEKNELHEQAEVAANQNLGTEQNDFLVKENPGNQGSDTEYKEHEVGGIESSEECNRYGKEQGDIGEVQNQQQKQKYENRSQQLKEQRESITGKEVEVAEMGTRATNSGEKSTRRTN